MAQDKTATNSLRDEDAALPQQRRDREGLPTGEETAQGNDVADPHPAAEEDYDKIPHPGGSNPPDAHDIGPNSYAHNGKAPPRPNSKGSMPQ
ncbi:MAG TPA: hypothetical protein VGB81_12630 [Devosia sp.]|jgi:hypothetical protein